MFRISCNGNYLAGSGVEPGKEEVMKTKIAALLAGISALALFATPALAHERVEANCRDGYSQRVEHERLEARQRRERLRHRFDERRWDRW